MEKNLDM